MGASPYVRYALAKATRKGEDCVVGCPTQPWPTGAWRATPGPRTYGLYAVIDGHNGAAAAEFTAAALPDRFALELRRALAELDGARDDAVQAALGATFLGLDADFGARGELSGATLTVCVVAGWNLSVANIGDSRAILDAGGNEARRPRAALRSRRARETAFTREVALGRLRPRERAHFGLPARCDVA
jgi:serine/threonine protein phosphatase PrpC